MIMCRVVRLLSSYSYADLVVAEVVACKAIRLVQVEVYDQDAAASDAVMAVLELDVQHAASIAVPIERGLIFQVFLTM